MQKTMTPIARILFVLFAAAGAAFTPGSAQAIDRLVTVTGEATVSAAPDAAIIRIGVTSEGRTARDATEANSRQMTAVLTAIKASGVAERDIQTAWLSVQPQYDQNRTGPAHLNGFRVSNQLTVKIRDIAHIPAVLDRAIEVGANEMSGIEFVVSEESKLRDQARAAAVDDARRKAELYAKAAGVKVGPVAEIAEEGFIPDGAAAWGDARGASGRDSGRPRRADAAGHGHGDLRIGEVNCHSKTPRSGEPGIQTNIRPVASGFRVRAFGAPRNN